MRITFKEIEDGLKNEVFVNGTYVGTVVKNVWNGKWTMRPEFSHFPSNEIIKRVKYDSFYIAGKALAKLYAETYVFFDEDRDTQELDMRGIFKRRTS